MKISKVQNINFKEKYTLLLIKNKNKSNQSYKIIIFKKFKGFTFNNFIYYPFI